MRSPANLDVKALAGFDGIRQPAQLRREFRDAVVLLKIMLALGCRLDAPLSLSLCRQALCPAASAAPRWLRRLRLCLLLVVIGVLETAHQPVSPRNQHAMHGIMPCPLRSYGTFGPKLPWGHFLARSSLDHLGRDCSPKPAL